jgi:transposase
MRYPDGGGLNAAGRARREKVRLQAAQLFEQDMPPVQVAHRLRVSTKSAYRWRRCWRAGGAAALASKGPGRAVCRLSAAQLARLRAELDKGPAVHGWAEDQRWTLGRVTTLTGRLFHVRYTLRGTSYLLHRIGFTPAGPGAPGGRAGRGRDRGVAGGDLGEGTRLAAATGAWICFECAARRCHFRMGVKDHHFLAVVAAG